MVEKYREDRDKQEHIIKSALKVFAQKGYGPVALDEIAREANLAKGTLYLYFQDKDDLVNKTILFVLDTIENAVRRNIDNTTSPLDILEQIVFNQLNIFLKNPDFFGLFFILSDPNLVSNREKLFNVLLERQSDLLDFEMRVIERAQELGLVKKELDAGEIAHLFDGMLTSAVHRLKFMGSVPVLLTATPNVRFKLGSHVG